jgi:hypothetical protein
MALKYEGLTPKGTKRADVAELARQPDPAHTTYELIRRAHGRKPAVQEVVSKGPAGPGRVRLPDMTGWPLRRAVLHARQLGIVPKVQGTGLLARQDPAPGDVVPEGASVTLIFEPAT